jgi:hypothetical protein
VRDSGGMDHIGALRDKIGRFRVEIAHIQELNDEYRLQKGNGAEAQVAQDQRHDRLQMIQHDLAQLAELGRKLHSVEKMKEKHRSRLHSVKQAQASA